MEDVLKQILYYLRDGRDLAELLPRAWASRNQFCKRSLLRLAFRKIGLTFAEIKFQGKWKQRIKQHRNPPSRAWLIMRRRCVSITDTAGGVQ